MLEAKTATPAAPAAPRHDLDRQWLSRFVAEWAVSTRYEDLPPEVVAAVVTFVTDHFGVVLGGTAKQSSRILFDVAEQWAPARGTSTILGRGVRTSPPLAALVNGASGHALELDDDHREGTQHPGVAIIPAAFSVAEDLGASGRDFIVAVALGFEIMIRLGEAHLGKSYLCGFHPTGTCGSIGAAVAAGKLLGLDVEQMTGAIGLGASQSSGLSTFRSNGAWNKRLHPGHAAQAGVLAAYLSSRGFRGPSESLLSPEGWLQAYAYHGEYDVERITGRLGQHWDLLENSIKVHACCRFAAPIVDATLAAVTGHDIAADQVASAVVGMAKFPLYRSLTEPRERKYHPTSVVDAQFSAPYAVAVSVIKRRAFVDEYSEDGIQDARVLALAKKVTWRVDEEAERLWPTRYPAQVDLTLTDGRVISSRVEWPKGDPENPVSPAELRHKFEMLASTVLGREQASAAYDECQRLASLGSVRGLGELLGGAATRSV
jgi:2-methylcitrate dehydratase PrpD